MKKLLIAALVSSTMLVSACSRVAPNEVGVLVTNYGKDVAKDYEIVTGRVITASPGSDLYTLPIYEQRNTVEEGLTNKASDGTEFTVKPRYSYRIDPDQAKMVIRQYSKLIKDSSGTPLAPIEKQALEPTITDVVREVVQSSSSDQLMATGGNTEFNSKVKTAVTQRFKERGFILMSFSTVLDYSPTVKASIDARNQANSQVATLDSQIVQARKQNELAQIQAETRKTTNQAITDQELKKLAIDKWDGKLPTTSLAEGVPAFLKP